MGDVTKTRVGNYDVSWTANGGTSYAHGYVDDVGVDLKLLLQPIKVGSIGPAILGHRVRGLSEDSKVTVECREIDLTHFQKMCPWFTTGSVALSPATINKDLYDYAGPLIVHPNDVTGTTQDITLVKAVALRGFMSRNGDDDDVVVIEYRVYPDRAQLPTLVYGYIGAAP